MMQGFLDALRCDATRFKYRNNISIVLGDVDGFIDLAKSDRRKAEDFLIKWVSVRRGKVTGTTIRGNMYALKSLLSFYEVDLNWRRINMSIPHGRRVASDRCPTVVEIRKLLSVCDKRMKACVLVMCCSGVRVGALESMNLKDYVKQDSGVGRLKIYRGEVEEYNTFITPESVAALDDYLDDRRRIGEVLKSDSPLFRDNWNCMDGQRHRLSPELRVNRISSKTLRTRLCYLWVKAGVREHISKRGEFQQAHGFRKWFKTHAERSMNRDDVEVLMGHILNYYKPSTEHLEEVYLKAVPFITVSEVVHLKSEYEAKIRERDQQIESMMSKILSLEVNVNNLVNLTNIKQKD